MPDNALVAATRDLIGEEAVKLIEILSEKEETTDDELIQKTGMKLNNLRKLLYQLFDQNLVSYRRVRDKDAGWFKYYWKINPTGINILLNAKKRKILTKLKERLEYETNNLFFMCPTHKTRYTFDDAMEINFQCPECGSRLDNVQNDDIVTVLKIKISEIEKNLAET
ncbi:MAG: transcription factor E [Candidatus Methanomethylicaceae archaeon]